MREKHNITKQELSRVYSEHKSIRKVAKLLDSTYQEIHFLIRFFKIPMRPPGNPILVPHRKYGQVLYKNGELVKDIEGRYIKQNGEKINL